MSYQEEVQDAGVGQERPEDEEHAGDHPRADGRHALDVRRHVGDRVENVDEHKEQGDKQCHSTRNDFRRNKEAHPGYGYEEAGGQVVDVEISERKVVKKFVVIVVLFLGSTE